jgi:hypothetical protein
LSFLPELIIGGFLIFVIIGWALLVNMPSKWVGKQDSKSPKNRQ